MQPAPPRPAARLVSPDAFRGLTVAPLLRVNHPGDWGRLNAFLAHAEWDGCPLADLVFPFFLFVGGVSAALGQALRRAAVLGLLYRRSQVWQA